MKNIFKYSLFAMFIGIVSCEDATDIIQADELPEELAFQTVEDLQTGLNGVYAAYGPDFGSNGSGDAIVFNALFTDNIKKGISSNGQGSQEYNFILQPRTSFAGAIWGNRYTTINFANRVLRAWERIAPDLEETDLTQANVIRGQLLALRALCHFDLMQYYVEDYQDASAPGVIIMDFVPELFDVFPRSTVGECFDFIKNDLNEANALLASANLNGSEEFPFYADQDVVEAITVRVLLNEGKPENYALIEELAENLVSAHPLATRPQYEALFLDDASGVEGAESIFILARRQGDNGIVNLWSANGPGSEGTPFYEVSNELANLYDASDIRSNVVIHPDSEYDEESPLASRIYVGKYRGRAESVFLNHVKLIRSSEMQLIKAEVEARQNKFTEARQSIVDLRTIRYNGAFPQPVMTNLNESLEVILLERRKELAFEGHRYLDLKRIGREIGVGIDRQDADAASFSAPTTLPPTDYRFTLPIPQTEVSANPTIAQNDGY